MEENFEFKWINTKLILSDQGYQRPVDPVRVALIVKNFDRNLVNPPKLSFRDGATTSTTAGTPRRVESQERRRD